MNTATERRCTKTAEPSQAKADLSPGAHSQQLKVRHVMHADVVTAAPTESIFSAVKRMCKSSVSCVVVVDSENVVGLFTERDLLRGITGENKGFQHLALGERMSSPAIVVSPETAVVSAGEIIKSERIKHLPVVADGRLVGIVTQTDITEGLIHLTPLQQVSDIMSTDIATIQISASVADAARIMSSRSITCVVVMHEEEPVGMLTQKDVLRKVIAFDKDPSFTEVADIMSVPILPIPSTHSVFTASRTMNKMRVHRLVVLEKGRVCGIVSQTDVLNAVHRALQQDEGRGHGGEVWNIPMFGVDGSGAVTCVNEAFMVLFALEGDEQVLGRPLGEALRLGAEDLARLSGVLGEVDGGLVTLAGATGEGTGIPAVVFVTRGNAASERHGVVLNVAGCSAD